MRPGALKPAVALAFAGAAMVVVFAGPAAADTLSFGDYYFDNQILASGFGSVTDGLVGYHITGPGDFRIAIEGQDWSGQFPHSVTVLSDVVAGALTITFDSPIASLTELSVQPRAFGAYQATLTAYDGATPIGSQSYAGFNDFGGEGTIPRFSFAAASITSVVITATNDAQGVGLGGTAGIPEPGSWTLMLSGVAGLGLILRRRRRRARVAAGA